MRLVALAAVLLAATVAHLYAVAEETRGLGERVAEREAETARVRAAITVLRAERGYLSRPSRIEPFARKIGMRPAEATQFARTFGDAVAAPPPGAGHAVAR